VSDVVDMVWTEGEASALEAVEKALPEQPREGIVLQATGVSVAFGGVRALRDVTVDIPARTFVGLIGPNGSGKTTLFNIINGFTVADSGRVEAFGHDVTREHPWNRAKIGISRTFQANHISPELTVRDNIMTGAYLSIGGGVLASVLQTPRVRAGTAQAEKLATATARLLGLEPYLEVRAGSLSFGGQRRTEIARCLMGGPRLLLLDEPSAGMDANEAQHLIGLVKRLHNDLGLAVCLVEHFIRMVFDNCSLIHVLARGEHLISGSGQQVAADPSVQAAYLGAPPEVTVA
jgi:ABC-type branched-subunit amino acid transport system ATPase component